MMKHFVFDAVVWIYEGPAAWHFITLPKDVSKEIDYYYSMAKKGWGSLPVNVTVGNTSWKTSIFPDKKSDSYILPLKLEVRKNEELVAGDTITLSLAVQAII